MGLVEPSPRSVAQILNAAAAFVLLVRSLASEANVVLVTLTPFWLMQLLNAAIAEALMPRPAPKWNPAGAYFWHALNAAEFAPPDAKPRPPGKPLGKAVGMPVPDGRGRGENDARGVIFMPCCFRQVWNALSPADWVALLLTLLDAALLPQPAMARHATTTGSAQRTRC